MERSQAQLDQLRDVEKVKEIAAKIELKLAALALADTVELE